MSEGDLQVIVSTINERFTEFRGEIRGDLREINTRLNALPCQRHAAQLAEIEAFRRGFWPRVLAVAGFVWVVITGVVAFFFRGGKP